MGRFDSLAEWHRCNLKICAQYEQIEYRHDLERRIEADKKRKAAEREAALPHELRTAMMGQDAYVKFGRDLLEWHCRKHDIPFRYLARNGETEGGANQRGITLPAPMSVEALITMAHEMGHRLAPPCPRSAPHLRIEHDRHIACIPCEIAAWRKAFELIPFSEDMARSAADSLKTHLRSTPATDDAKRQAERFMRLETWRHQQRLDDHARMVRELEAEGIPRRR